MGILPLQFKPNENADKLGLTGHESFTINTSNIIDKPNMEVEVTTSCGKKFTALSRLDTEVELTY
jgi:aconitate hydratase